MPRTAANGPSTGLSLRSGAAKGQNVGDKRKKPTLRGTVKTAAIKTAKTRAALGEITNASNNDKSKSLKNQVKKGFSSIVGRSKSSATTSNSSSSSNKLSTAERIEKSVQNLNQAKTEDSSIEDNTTGSLPSSQEEESVQRLKQILPRPELDVSKSSTESEDYVSASEGDEPERTVVFAKKNTYRYVPPARVVPPEGIIDFDLENMDDLTTCSEYVGEVFQYYRNREAQFCCPNYLANQPEVTEMMRAIVVDWLVEVQESFELNHETLYTAVKLMDLYMSKVRVAKEELQLIGAVSCLIACKIDERIPPNLDDFVYVCDDAYKRRDIIRKELKMISTVGYDVGFSLSYRFLRRYGRVCRINMPDLTYARFVLEMSLMDYQFNVEISESLLAAAALALALRIKEIENWENLFEFYTGYSLDDVESMSQKLLKMMQRTPNEHTKTIRLKYSHRVFYEAANVRVPRIVYIQKKT